MSDNENEKQIDEVVDHTPFDAPAETPVVAETEQPEPEDDEKKELKSKYRRETRNRKKLERELSDIKKQVDELRYGHVGSAVEGRLNAIGQEYAAAEKSYAEALSTQDPTRITLANRNLLQKYTAWVLGNEKANQIKEQQQQRQQQQPLQPENRALTKWKARNDWYEDPEFDDEKEMAAKIDNRLASEWDEDEIGSSEYFDELDRRLAKKMPHLYKGKTGGSQNVAGSSRSASTPTRVTLPKELIEAARTLGRNVDDPAWRKRMAEQYVRKR